MVWMSRFLFGGCMLLMVLFAIVFIMEILDKAGIARFPSSKDEYDKSWECKMEAVETERDLWECMSDLEAERSISLNCTRDIEEYSNGCPECECDICP